eukprot:2380521-Rhodomonas_salina.1
MQMMIHNFLTGSPITNRVSSWFAATNPNAMMSLVNSFFQSAPALRVPYKLDKSFQHSFL